MKCPSCTKEIRDDLKYCPHCGMRIIKPGPPEPTRTRSRARESAEAVAKRWSLFVAIIVLAAATYFGYLGYDAYTIHKSFEQCRLHRRTGNYYEGITACEHLLSRRPRIIEGWVELARCHDGLQDYKAALKAADNGLDWGKNAELFAIKGEVLYKKENYKSAGDTLRNALALEPDHREANMYLGYILASRDEMDKAVKHLEKALDGASPMEIVEINLIIGDMHAEEGDYEAAATAYEKVRNQDMNDIDACMKLAQVYIQLARFDEALRESDRCIQIDPQSDDARKLHRKARRNKERMDTISYILKRKELDDILMMLYSALKTYIERFNADPDAFIGSEAFELSQMIEDSQALYDSYSKLKPTESYSHVHANILGNVATMIDTMKKLRQFITTGESQYMTSLTRMLDNLEKRMNNLVLSWKREDERLDIEKLRREAIEMGAATDSITFSPSGKEKETPPEDENGGN